MDSKISPKILIVGATGFVGSNLLKAFEEKSVPVRALSRQPERILSDSPATEKIQGDLDDPSSLEKALEGIETIYYLAHAMGYAGDGFGEREKQQAQNLAGLLKENQKIVYLGGIVPESFSSPHLESRKSVGAALKKSKGKTVEFRASIIVGAGSASFEMIRALVYRLPFIVTADWADSMSQPIAIKDVVTYLLEAKDKKFRKKHVTLEIGGEDRLPYKELLTIFSKEEGLLRPELHLKHFPKKAAKEVMKIVIPEYYDVGSKLLDSIEIPTIADNAEALKHFPFEPMGYRQAVVLAKDPELKEINFSETLRKLKNHPEIPNYLVGQTLQKYFYYQDLGQLRDLAELIGAFLPGKIKDLKQEEYSAKIPFVGEFKVVFNQQAKFVYLGYKPKYFFQSAGWTLFDKLANQAFKITGR